MVIHKRIEINKNIQDVWEILGHDFAHPYKWASAVNHSEGHSNQLASMQCDERSCQTTMGNIREKITHYSDKTHTLSYDIVEGLPFFVAAGKNNWSLTKVSAHKTVLSIKMEMTLKPWAIFMSPVTKIMFNKLALQLSEDFAYYAEKGKPHPRKIRAQRKSQRPGNGLPTFYFLAFLVGTLVPLYFITHFILEAGGIMLSEFIQQLFANHAASTFSSDLLITSFIFWIFMVYDKRKKNLPHILYFLVLNLTIGLSAAFPLYLYFRERRRAGVDVK